MHHYVDFKLCNEIPHVCFRALQFSMLNVGVQVHMRMQDAVTLRFGQR